MFTVEDRINKVREIKIHNSKEEISVTESSIDDKYGLYLSNTDNCNCAGYFSKDFLKFALKEILKELEK